MNLYVVFDDKGVFLEERNSVAEMMPHGFYVLERFQNGAINPRWFRVSGFKKYKQIPDEEVPKIIKMTCLALNLHI